MPPIQIHKNDPIAAKPDGVTPQTDSSDPSTANPPPTRTVPASVPATTTADPSLPPPPQPGARPLAPTASKYIPPSSDPPPPQPAGYTATHHVTETRLGGPPPQFHVPPPTDAQLAGRSTTTSTQPSKPGPTTLNMGSAPPGASPYQQEHRGGAVQELPRSVLEGPPGYVQAPDNTQNSAAALGTGSGGQDSAGGDGGIGGAAWGLLAKAGEALKKGEEAAWKAVRNN